MFEDFIMIHPENMNSITVMTFLTYIKILFRSESMFMQRNIASKIDKCAKQKIKKKPKNKLFYLYVYHLC